MVSREQKEWEEVTEKMPVCSAYPQRPITSSHEPPVYSYYPVSQFKVGWTDDVSYNLIILPLNIPTLT